MLPVAAFFVFHMVLAGSDGLCHSAAGHELHVPHAGAAGQMCHLEVKLPVCTLSGAHLFFRSCTAMVEHTCGLTKCKRYSVQKARMRSALERPSSMRLPVCYHQVHGCPKHCKRRQCWLVSAMVVCQSFSISQAMGNEHKCRQGISMSSQCVSALLPVVVNSAPSH